MDNQQIEDRILKLPEEIKNQQTKVILAKQKE